MTAANTPSPAALSRAVAESLPLAERLFAELQARTGDGVGLTRDAYGKGEQIAHDLVAEAARSLGLEVRADAAGNLTMTLAGRDRARPGWFSGSHLDTVPRGGNYDGAAGALAALAALTALKRLGHRPAADLTAIAIRCEEAGSWFGGRHGGHLGSRAALGLLWPGELDSAVRLDTGKSLAWHMEAAGFDPARVRSGPPLLGPERVRGFVELHIEQGPVLEAAGLPLGIVTSIRGSLRARSARCLGAYTHSGAVPKELRHDAVLATVELLGELDRAWDGVLARGQDLVFTVGKLFTDPEMHGLSKVPGEVRFTLDIRSQETATMRAMEAEAQRLAAGIGARRGVRFELGPFALSEPAAMDRGIRERLAEGCRALAIPHQEMPCGAGHDAADFTRVGIPAAMIFVRNQGGSHNPGERMEIADFGEGVRLLAWFLATADLPPPAGAGFAKAG
ncbi:MAG: Zn-dependent hydrolase [Proteobacteria bacterium]|nr:Zn-dependent hydrolase [Pseudomonadota bacterium]